MRDYAAAIKELDRLRRTRHITDLGDAFIGGKMAGIMWILGYEYEDMDINLERDRHDAKDENSVV